MYRVQIQCAYARFENVGSKLPYFGEHIFLHLFSRNVLLQEGASKPGEFFWEMLGTSNIKSI